MSEKCSCGFKRETGTETLPLIFPIPINEKDLQSSFNTIFNPEVVTVKCDQCFKPNTLKRINILSVPDVFILLVKRYQFDHNTKLTTKDLTPVNCPNELQLPCGTILTLKAIINHYGENPNVGHYTALLRDQKKDLIYHCDDEDITLLSRIPEETNILNYVVVYCKT